MCLASAPVLPQDVSSEFARERAPASSASVSEADLDYTPVPNRRRLLEPLPSSDLPKATTLADDSVEPMSNDDVIRMLRAEFGEPTILAAMEANPTAFDVTPRQLVALKSVGVPETIIEAMLAEEAARAPSVPPTGPIEESAQSLDAATLESMELLTRALERLATEDQQRDAEPVRSELPAAAVPPIPTKPRAWAVRADTRLLLPPSVAQVAFTDAKSGRAANALQTLENLSSRKALAFASPALAVANEIGGLFRSNDPSTTAVWALPGASAGRVLEPGGELEIEFGSIPGVNPDEYRPAVVQLVPTMDNFRVVGAAKTKVSDLDAGVPTEPIIEESIAARADRLDRGRYLIQLDESIAPGEYALVLRPTERDERKRRNDPTSLGELLGSGASDVLYTTWDFSVGASLL